jgi:hypothetical protein
MADILLEPRLSEPVHVGGCRMLPVIALVQAPGLETRNRALPRNINPIGTICFEAYDVRNHLLLEVHPGHWHSALLSSIVSLVNLLPVRKADRQLN